ncbi:MAG: ATP-dependent DNA helicase [Terriglobus roseus]|nr:ATP-dependent DNA helicase [Terriglobus roseus]
MADPSVSRNPPAVLVRHGRASLLTADGEILDLDPADAADRLVSMDPPIVLHRPDTARRLGVDQLPSIDLLELCCLVLPSRQIIPTPRGLLLALDLPDRKSAELDAGVLAELAQELLQRATRMLGTPAGDALYATASVLTRWGWGWGAIVRSQLGASRHDPSHAGTLDVLAPWEALPKWADEEPRHPTRSAAVAATEARQRLARVLGEEAEHRVGQADYAGVAAAAFSPEGEIGDPRLVLAEAGTGTGKTLGYLASASLWSERTGGSVWISTHTRHLQRQIALEARRYYPDHADWHRRIVIRKGRENYLCLLNFDELAKLVRDSDHGASLGIPLALLSLWIRTTTDGDVVGGDLPGWFGELFGRALMERIVDRRGECVHGACRHYQRCFVEHSIRRARGADLVIANHALVMVQAASRARSLHDQDDTAPERYIFDEGHHLIDAADAAFATELSGFETADLRRWLLGPEGGSSRSRGLKSRLWDLVGGQNDLESLLAEALTSASCLPAPGWLTRVDQDPGRIAAPGGDVGDNPSEGFLRFLKRHVLHRSTDDPRYRQGGDWDLHPVDQDLADAAERLEISLRRIAEPLTRLVDRMSEALNPGNDTLDAAMRERLKAASRTIRRRGLTRLDAWSAMLRSIANRSDGGDAPVFVTFARMIRSNQKLDGSGTHAGLYQHWLDPTVPFTRFVAQAAKGVLVTSATLRDESNSRMESSEALASWTVAERLVGAHHLPSPAVRAALMSPFNYSDQAKCLIVTDVDNADVVALASAYASLFRASGGGGLGLFTAINRLRLVYEIIREDLEGLGLPLLAQHVDPMGNATLLDIFRLETDSCLLGTDAMRDGVDVPGRALRLVVFERTPWPRPDLLHRQRKTHLYADGGRRADDRMARLRLRQAFGRLIRSTRDRGVFVLLDRQLPSRLLSAFPDGVTPRRVSLAEAIRETRTFCSTDR